MGQIELLHEHAKEMAPGILDHMLIMDGDRENPFTIGELLRDNTERDGNGITEPDVEEMEGVVMLQVGGVAYLASGCGWNTIERIS